MGTLVRHSEIISEAILGPKIPYSAKFSRDKIFADWPLTNFRRNKFHRSRIPVSHTQFRWPLNTLFTHSCSNAMLGCSLCTFG